jgi:hypothetical protein
LQVLLLFLRDHGPVDRDIDIARAETMRRALMERPILRAIASSMVRNGWSRAVNAGGNLSPADWQLQIS